MILSGDRHPPPVYTARKISIPGNLSRQIWVSVDETNPEDRDKKIRILRLVVAFSVATKLHLRGEGVNKDLEELMPISKYLTLNAYE